MTIYLQSLCSGCKRIFAFAHNGDTSSTIKCPYCGCNQYTRPVQISRIEFLEVNRLYTRKDS